MPSILKRLWRSKGHGVHSPFAFRFITAVLRNDSTAYYAYAFGLDDAAGKRRRQIRRLYRVAVELRPESITLPKGWERFERFFRPQHTCVAGRTMTISEQGSRLIVTASDRSGHLLEIDGGCELYRLRLKGVQEGQIPVVLRR